MAETGIDTDSINVQHSSINQSSPPSLRLHVSSHIFNRFIFKILSFWNLDKCKRDYKRIATDKNTILVVVLLSGRPEGDSRGPWVATWCP